MNRERLVLEPLAGHEGEIGLFLAALGDSRQRTKESLADLDAAALDRTTPTYPNSIGTLLYHIAAIEMDWLYIEILERDFPEQVILRRLSTRSPLPLRRSRRKGTADRRDRGKPRGSPRAPKRHAHHLLGGARGHDARRLLPGALLATLPCARAAKQASGTCLCPKGYARAAKQASGKATPSRAAAA
jgi:hypothetical protein